MRGQAPSLARKEQTDLKHHDVNSPEAPGVLWGTCRASLIDPDASFWREGPDEPSHPNLRGLCRLLGLLVT